MFTINYVPKRIISLVPSQTELLYDLGLEEAIVGITKFCVHPANALKNKQIVGGTKNIKLERIIALQPDIILCNKEENTKEIVTLCSQVTHTHVSDIYTIEDAKMLIQTYGAIFEKKAAALRIVSSIESQLHLFKEFIKQKPLLKVAYFIWRAPWMVAGNTTFINSLLTLNKFHNIYSDLERYPEVDISSMQGKHTPDLILLSSEPYPFKQKHVQEIKTYVPQATILLVDGELFSWYGSRLTKSFDYFKSLRNDIEKLIC
jgi:ABC-type Fe3+-hydroxamate transport system substrate-binding protein